MSNGYTKLFSGISYGRKKLSWRIFLTIFLAFLGFQLLLLYPIARYYEIAKLQSLEQQALLSIRTLFNTLPTKTIPSIQDMNTGSVDNTQGIKNIQGSTKNNTNTNPSLNTEDNLKNEKNPHTDNNNVNTHNEHQPIEYHSIHEEKSEEVRKIAISLSHEPLFRGVVIAHSDGTPFLRFGEKPNRPMNDLPALSYISASLRDENGTRYDVSWDGEEDSLPYDVTLRLDTSHFEDMLGKFILKAFMLMVLLAMINTGIVYIIIKKTLLNSLQKLRAHLINISNDISHPERFILKQFPENEFGDIENTCNILLKKFMDAQRIIQTHDKVLELRVKERTHELLQLVNYDVLTELPNRNLLQSTVTELIEQAKKDNNNIVVMLIILRDFHEINNVYGQMVGTQLLKEVARILVENAPGGTFIAHLSTSRFAIARGGLVSAHHIANLARWLVELFNKPLMIQKQNILVSVNIGVAIYPMNGDDAESLIANANLALKRAIDGSPNSYEFYEMNMNKVTEARRSILVDLHYAIERNELIAYYQPQVNLKTNEIIGVEALIRWMHPEKGLMPPAFFLSLAEESGLIVPMGEWILEEACLQARKWQVLGLPKLSMAVNLSGSQFKQRNIIEVIRRILEKTEFPAEQLELEITESIIIDNIQTAIATMKALRTLGVSISLDDFGTGYSSLSYLRRFPVQKLKIDQSFVRDIDIEQEKKEEPLADIILLLAQNLNIRSIAEGIETEEQAEYLRTRGCLEGQGYLFGKPMTADEIKTLVTSKRQLPN